MYKFLIIFPAFPMNLFAGENSITAALDAAISSGGQYLFRRSLCFSAVSFLFKSYKFGEASHKCLLTQRVLCLI